jgi:cytochrome c-type biogenesis protein
MTSHLMVVLVCVVLMVAVMAVALGRPSVEEVFEPRDAPPISTEDLDGEPFDLGDHTGNVTLLHFTAIEEPVCLECEKQMREQMEELRILASGLANATVVTVNMRNNPMSDDGRTLAERWWQLEVDWTWIEDWSPYSVSGPYDEYWTYRGAVSNPCILLVDGELRIVAVFHVYQMGSGEVDGVQRAGELGQAVEAIHAGEWEGFEGEVTTSPVTVGTMFALGVITSLTPCSIALMAIVISYIMSARRRSQGGMEEDGRSASVEGLTIGVTFTLGMAMVFFVIGCFLSQVGALVSASNWFYLVAGILVIVFGVNSLYPLSNLVPSGLARRPRRSSEVPPRPGLLQRAVSRLTRDGSSGPIVGLVLGVLFSLAWAPCAVSLILPVFIWVVSQGYSMMVAGGLLFVFGLGHGVPVIPMAILGRTARGRLAERSARVGKWVTTAFAIAVVVFGVILVARFFGVALW